MTIILPRTPEVAGELPARAVVALGVFDGVHRGHRALLAAAREFADRLGVPLAALTFSDTAKDGAMLTTPKMRTRLFAEVGVDIAVFYSFAELSHLTPAAFVREVLFGVFGAVGAVCGTDFRFGHNRAGDAATLANLLAPHSVQIVPAVRSSDGEVISTTRIRTAIANGDLATANHLLGAPYTLAGTVTHGRRLGHKLHAPTANLQLPAGAVLPPFGVYITRTETADGCYPSITNIGRNPTVVTDGQVMCETHLLCGAPDLYGKEIAVSLLAHVRAECAFADADALAAQIAADITAARAYFAAHPSLVSNPEEFS